MHKQVGAVLLMLTSVGIARGAPPPADFVKQAGASDLYEITSSKLLTTSANPKVKAFANRMITDHNKSTAMVKAAAMQSGLKPMPPQLTPKQSADVAALRAARGTTRDGLYIAQQKAAHAEALALHQDNAATGNAPALKAASVKIIPVVQHHKSEIDAM